jgi:phenylalanyl-tRNA synthetase beta chain
MEKVRGVMLAAGISEAMTPSVVDETLDQLLSPWTDRRALETRTPVLKGATRLRRSLIPSLLQCRADNWAAASIDAHLYEVAHLYLPGAAVGDLPAEQYSLGLAAGCDFFALKGILEGLLRGLGCRQRLTVAARQITGFEPSLSVELRVGEQMIGYLGQIDPTLTSRLKLPGSSSAAELALPVLFAEAELVPQYRPVSPFPAIHRDLNLIVDEAVRWADLETSTRHAVGVELAGVDYRETYRDPQKDGAGTKRILFSVALQKPDATLTGEEADRLMESIVARCREDHGARLLEG